MLISTQLIPHNLPPCSAFIGREDAKVRVHAALCSRAYLISIGGIGKSSLALEVAYGCLQVSRYVKMLNARSYQQSAPRLCESSRGAYSVAIVNTSRASCRQLMRIAPEPWSTISSIW